jgi:hypothetical protein
VALEPDEEEKLRILIVWCETIAEVMLKRRVEWCRGGLSEERWTGTAGVAAWGHDERSLVPPCIADDLPTKGNR